MSSSNSADIQPQVAAFFGRFPAAESAYAATPLYHLTHSMYVPGILRDGLQSNPSLFPADHGQFLLDMYRRYGSGQPNDMRYIQDKILDPRTIYLSREQPNMDGFLAYGVPERLMLLMRGMHALSQKQSLSEGERNFARQALASHEANLTAGKPAITALEVNPMAPALVNNRLGILALHKVNDAETAVWLAEHADGAQGGNNIPVVGTVQPSYIQVFGETPITTERAMRGVAVEPDWVTSIR